MKRFWTSLVLVAILCIITSVGLAEEQRATVFRDLAWGDPPEALGPHYEISMEDPEPGIKAYYKKDELRQLGEISTGAIEYYFFNDRLFKIIVFSAKAEGKEEYDMFQRMLTTRYGEPKKRLLSNTLTWNAGDTSVQLVWEIMGRVWFVLESIPLKLEYDAWLDAYKDKKAKASAESW